MSQCRRGAAFGVAPAIDIPTPAASVAMAKIVLPWRDLPVVSSENEDVKDVVRFEAMRVRFLVRVASAVRGSSIQPKPGH